MNLNSIFFPGLKVWLKYIYVPLENPKAMDQTLKFSFKFK